MTKKWKPARVREMVPSCTGSELQDQIALWVWRRSVAKAFKDTARRVPFHYEQWKGGDRITLLPYRDQGVQEVKSAAARIRQRFSHPRVRCLRIEHLTVRARLENE